MSRHIVISPTVVNYLTDSRLVTHLGWYTCTIRDTQPTASKPTNQHTILQHAPKHHCSIARTWDFGGMSSYFGTIFLFYPSIHPYFMDRDDAGHSLTGPLS